MKINEHDFIIIAKNAVSAKNQFSIILKYFLEKHLQIMATLLEKVNIFFSDIFGDRLVNVSMGVILRICFKTFRKWFFFLR